MIVLQLFLLVFTNAIDTKLENAECFWHGFSKFSKKTLIHIFQILRLFLWNFEIRKKNRKFLKTNKYFWKKWKLILACSIFFFQKILICFFKNFIFFQKILIFYSKISILFENFDFFFKNSKFFYFENPNRSKLSGYLDDCSCEIPTLDQYNNVVVFPQIHRLMQRNFFRFYKANTGRKCKYWNLDWKCRFSTGGCTVEACKPNEIPTGIKGKFWQNIFKKNFENSGNPKFF